MFLNPLDLFSNSVNMILAYDSFFSSFVFGLNIPVNNFSVMLGHSLNFELKIITMSYRKHGNVLYIINTVLNFSDIK